MQIVESKTTAKWTAVLFLLSCLTQVPSCLIVNPGSSEPSSSEDDPDTHVDLSFDPSFEDAPDEVDEPELPIDQGVVDRADGNSDLPSDSEADEDLDLDLDLRDDVADVGSATTWWVDPDGSDDADGLTDITPLRTISAALNNAEDGDEIRLTAGVHDEEVSGLAITTDILIIGSGSDESFFDGSNAVHTGIRITGNVNITGLTFIDTKSSTEEGGGGIHIAAGAMVYLGDVVFDNCRVAHIYEQNGGAIHNSGSLFAHQIRIAGNHEQTALLGAGIYNAPDAVLEIEQGTFMDFSNHQNGVIYNNAGSVDVSQSTFSGNTAGDGGALYNAGELTLENCTFSGNTSESRGAALYNVESATAVVNNCTIVDNTGPNGIVTNDGGTVTLSNTVLSNSQNDCGGLLTIGSDGHNIASDVSCGFDATGDSVVSDLWFAQLADNGGYTQTHAIPFDSEAVDNGDHSTCATADQRGAPRSGQCDIGAYEANIIFVSVTDGNDESADPRDRDLPLATIRQALTLTSGNGFDLIQVFDGTYEEGEVLPVELSVTIWGETTGGTVLDGNGGHPLIHVVDGHAVNLRNMTLRDGFAAVVDGSYGGCLSIGNSHVRLTDVVFDDCTAAGGGGAIANYGGLSALRVTITGPDTTAAPRGGGLYNADGAGAMFDSSTFSGISVTGDGGAIWSSGDVTLNISTLSGNSASRGGAVALDHGHLDVFNSTVSGNTATSTGAAIHSSDDDDYAYLGFATVVENTASGGSVIFEESPTAVIQAFNTILDNPSDNCSDVLISSHGNIDNGTSCGLEGPDDYPDTPSGVSGLENNTGPTQTHALNEGSFAIDRAHDLYCPTNDQRGVIRPQRERCDIGAFELE